VDGSRPASRDEPARLFVSTLQPSGSRSVAPSRRRCSGSFPQTANFGTGSGHKRLPLATMTTAPPLADDGFVRAARPESATDLARKAQKLIRDLLHAARDSGAASYPCSRRAREEPR
jgi:hypothetical protein